MLGNIVMEISGALLRVWRKHWSLPLSGRLEDISQEYGSNSEAAAMIFAGWLIGVVIMFAGWFAGSVFNRTAGAVVFAAAAWVVLLYRDRGRGDCEIASRIARRLPGEYIQQTVVIPLMLMIVKFALLTAVFCCCGGTALPLAVGSCAALEALLLMDAGFSPPVIRNSETARKRFWVTAVVLTVISFFCGRPVTAVSALIFALLWHFAGGRIHKEGMTAGDIRLWSALCVWFILLAGVFMI